MPANAIVRIASPNVRCGLRIPSEALAQQVCVRLHQARNDAVPQSRVIVERRTVARADESGQALLALVIMVAEARAKRVRDLASLDTADEPVTSLLFHEGSPLERVRIVEDDRPRAAASRMEAGSVEMRREPVDLLGLLADIIAHLGKEDGGRIRVDIARAVPPASYDRERMECAVENLLTNALTTSRRTARLRCKSRGREARWWSS